MMPCVRGYALVFLLCACGGSAVPDTTYKGAFVGASGQNGTAVVTRAAHNFNLQATLHLASGPVGLNGALDPAGGIFTIFGNGYQFGGNLANDVVVGTYTAPSDTGRFALIDETKLTAVYCGTFTGNGGGALDVVQGNSGVVRAPFAGASLSGVASGTFSGTNFTASAGSTNFTGTFTGATSVSGTYSASGGSGTFSATAAACPQ